MVNAPKKKMPFTHSYYEVDTIN